MPGLCLLSGSGEREIQERLGVREKMEGKGKANIRNVLVPSIARVGAGNSRNMAGEL